MGTNLGGHRPFSSIDGRRVFLLDYRRADVTGDGIADNICLYGNKPGGPRDVYADGLTLVIQDGRTHRSKAVTPACRAGRYPRLFLGDFDGDGINDIKVTLEGSGGSVLSCIYSFKKSIPQELLAIGGGHTSHGFSVDFDAWYKVCIRLPDHRAFTVDLSARSAGYLARLYDDYGRLLHPVRGDVCPLSALTPVVLDEVNGTYGLLARRRVTGVSPEDTLGYLENLLRWDKTHFAPEDMSFCAQAADIGAKGAPGGILKA